MDDLSARAMTAGRPSARGTAGPTHTPAWAGYLAAFVIGIVFVASVFPSDILRGAVLPDYRYGDDIAVAVVGQRAFLRDVWHWPLLWTTTLDWPRGLSIAMTDSIPLLSLLLKLLTPLLPAGFSGIFAWLALSYLLQPVAAVFALRSLGERRLVPAVTVALLAISLPTFLFRFGHVALSSHFTILTAIGSYARTVRGLPGRRWLPPVLLPLTLLIHPYLAFMVGAVLAAAPLSLATRGDRRWRSAALVVLGALALMVAIAAMCGYVSDPPGGGFGVASMNVLSPIWRVLPTSWVDHSSTIDATGLQYEGYQYLGAGLLLLMAIAILTARRWQVGRALGTHAGLVIAAGALTALALSNAVYVGHTKILDLGPVPAVFQQLRSSGRLFWPVAYVLLLGSVAVIAQNASRFVAWPVLLLAACLQVTETTGMRTHSMTQLHRTDPRTIDVGRLEAALAGQRHLVLLPIFGCGLDLDTPGTREMLLAASRYPIDVNTMFTARMTGAVTCEDGRAASALIEPGELRVFLAGKAITGPLSVPETGRVCRRLGPIGICTTNTKALAGLPAVTPSSTPVGPRLAIVSATPFLGTGWSSPEPNGVWSVGPDSTLMLRPDAQGSKPNHLTLRVRMQAFTAGGGPVRATVSVNGRVATEWLVKDDEAIQSVALGVGDGPDGDTYDVGLHMSRTVRPSDHGASADTRDLGVFVYGLGLTE